MADEHTHEETNSDATSNAARPTSAGLFRAGIVILVVLAVASIWLIAGRGAGEAEARAKIKELGALVTPGADDEPIHSINLSLVKDQESLDTIVEQLAAFTQLKNLNAQGVPLEDNHLEIIGQLDGLIGLYMAETDVSDKGMAHLADLDGLINLTLFGTGVGNRGLEEIGKLKSIKILNIGNTKVSGELRQISEMENLEWLVASGLTLSDESAGTLTALKNLSHLTIDGAIISDEAVQEILKKKPNIGLDR